MTDKEAKIWKEGYDTGAKAMMRQNDAAIKIGQAIIDTLDERYAFREEDY
jgi:hypothetical protein